MRKLSRLLNDLRARGGKLDPRRPSGIAFVHDGEEVPEGARLVIDRGPRVSADVQRHQEEKLVLLGQLEMSGADNTPEAVAARWRAAGLALPGEAGYVPDALDEYYARRPLVD
jgi:hypothetical protein